VNISHTRIAVVCFSVLAGFAVACSSSSPSEPSGAVRTDGVGAGPSGETLKVGAPELLAPANGTTLTSASTVTFTVGRISGKHASFPVTFEFDIAKQGGPQIDNTRLVQAATGNSSFTMVRELEINTAYTVRVRATFNNLVGPWSPVSVFRSPDIPQPYMRLNGAGTEIFDPLTNGKTVGTIFGPTQFIPGVGLKLIDHSSHVTYALPANLQAGELSIMITGVDEGSPGDKSKVMSMQEGPEEFDITDDDYRFTAELRGRSYNPAGAVTFRIITGGGDENVFDATRLPVNFTDTRWYFWKFTWSTGSARLEVREDSPTGPILYSQSRNTGTHPYRPTPHLVHLGSPIGRNGAIDATIAGLTVKDVWLSSSPRPVFPVVR
jgi:hypothetical protein